MKASREIEGEGEVIDSERTQSMWNTAARPPAIPKARAVPSLLWLLLVALMGAALGTVSLLKSRPTTYLLPIWITHSLQNEAGIHGPLETDRAVIVSPSLFANQDPQAKRNPSKAAVLSQLQALETLSSTQPTLVYLSAFACLDPTQEVYLIPDNCNPQDPGSRLYLSEVLQRLRMSPSQQKLLVLDITWPFAIPGQGVYQDDVAGRIAETISRIQDPSLACLTACSPGQRSWTMLSPRRSVFNFFLEKGLLGEADGYVDDQQDGRISVRELANYLSCRVDAYSSLASPARQTPVLLGSAIDFEVVAYSQSVSSKDPTDADAAVPFPEWLATAWSLRDELVTRQAWRVSPGFVRRFENTILHAEMNWRRGENSQRLSSSLTTNLGLLADEFNDQMKRLDDGMGYPNSAFRVHVPDLSLLVKQSQPPGQPAAADSPKADNATSETAESTAGIASDQAGEAAVAGPSRLPNQDSLQLVLERFIRTWNQQWKMAKPEDRNAVTGKLVQQLQEETKAVEDSDYLTALNHFLQSATSLTPPQVIALAGTLEQRSTDPLDLRSAVISQWGSSLETAQWEAASQSPDDYLRQAQHLLSILQYSEMPLSDPESWDWIAASRSRADDRRYVTETVFWNPGYVQLETSWELTRRTERAFDNESAVALRLQQCWSALDQAVWRLPQLTSYVELGDWTAQDRRVKTLCKAMELSAELDSLLHQSSNSDPDTGTHKPADLEHASVVAQELQDALDDLLDFYQPARVQETLTESAAAGAGLLSQVMLQHLLESPFCDCPTRKQLHQAARELSARRHQQALVSYQRPSRQLLARKLSQVDQARSLQQAESRAGMRKQLTLYRERFPHLDAKNETKRFQRKVAAVQRHWQHRASLYRKLGQDSPYAEVYQGLAQHYRQMLEQAVESPLHMDAVSVDRRVQIGLPASQWTIPFFESSISPVFSTASYPGKNNDQKQAAENVIARVLPVPGSQLQARATVVDHQVVLDLQSPRSTVEEPANPVGNPGLFVEVHAGQTTQLHRVMLPGLTTQKQIKLLVGKDSQTATELGALRVRPGVESQAFAFFLRNPSNQTRPVKVALGEHQVEATLAPRSTTPIVIPGKAPKPGTPLTSLSGPLSIQVDDTQSGESLLSDQLNVQVASPREYVQIDGAKFTPYGGGRNRLEVTVSRSDATEESRPAIDGDIDIRLILDNQQIPGLLAVQGGLFSGKLPKSGDPLTLYAENLVLDERTTERGVFSLEVDGIPRTFVFEMDFARQGSPTYPLALTQPAVTIDAPAVGLAAAGLPVALKTQNAPGMATLQMRLRQDSSEGLIDRQYRLPSPQCHHFSYAPDGHGGLLFQATVKDWSLELDATGLVGKRRLEAELLLDGRVIASTAKMISLDNRPPQFVRFEDLPQRVAVGTPWTVEAKAISPLTGIEKVQLFWGAPENDAIPAKAKPITCEVANASSAIWSGQLQVPKELGPAELTVCATNGAGLTTFETRQVELVTAASLDCGNVKGQVFEGVRPQPNLDVQLLDSNYQVIAATKTQFDGQYQFKEVRSGQYMLRSAKPATGRSGAVVISITAGNTTQADLTLQLN